MTLTLTHIESDVQNISVRGHLIQFIYWVTHTHTCQINWFALPGPLQVVSMLNEAQLLQAECSLQCTANTDIVMYSYLSGIYILWYCSFLQCFDAVGWAAGRASGL